MFWKQAAKMTIKQAADIPTISLAYKLGKLAPPSAPTTTGSAGRQPGPSTPQEPSKKFNDRIALYRGDITTLAVDAIVNAANKSLLGGGGVDGAIHRAAGRGLLEECRTLDGCPTGSAKITDAYDLPCRKVIHAVGPIYDGDPHGKSERALSGCYRRSLELACANDCRTIAFSAISTGVYGYPSKWAASTALQTVRQYLTEGTSLIDKVIFVTFEEKDFKAYNELTPQFFPPVKESPVVTDDKDSMAPHTDTKSSAAGTDDKDLDLEAEDEARAVANELPDPPTTDPSSDTEHVGKKQKMEGDA